MKAQRYGFFFEYATLLANFIFFNRLAMLDVAKIRTFAVYPKTACGRKMGKVKAEKCL
jgi:hypothetical protein